MIVHSINSAQGPTQCFLKMPMSNKYRTPWSDAAHKVASSQGQDVIFYVRLLQFLTGAYFDLIAMCWCLLAWFNSKSLCELPWNTVLPNLILGRNGVFKTMYWLNVGKRWWCHLRIDTLLRNEYSRPWSDAAHTVAICAASDQGLLYLFRNNESYY